MLPLAQVSVTRPSFVSVAIDVGAAAFVQLPGLAGSPSWKTATGSSSP